MRNFILGICACALSIAAEDVQTLVSQLSTHDQQEDAATKQYERQLEEVVHSLGIDEAALREELDAPSVDTKRYIKDQEFAEHAFHALYDRYQTTSEVKHAIETRLARIMRRVLAFVPVYACCPDVIGKLLSWDASLRLGFTQDTAKLIAYLVFLTGVGAYEYWDISTMGYLDEKEYQQQRALTSLGMVKEYHNWMREQQEAA